MPPTGRDPASPAVSGAGEGRTTPPAVDITGESVAGEEDPGAAIDLALPTGGQRCHTCGGSGMRNGAACPGCEGTGKITTAAKAPVS